MLIIKQTYLGETIRAVRFSRCWKNGWQHPQFSWISDGIAYSTALQALEAIHIIIHREIAVKSLVRVFSELEQSGSLSAGDYFRILRSLHRAVTG